MLEDAAGIRRVVLACGTVDLRKALMDWQRSSAISMGKIPSKRERSFCFAESVPIGARDSCGWVPDFYFCTNALRQDDYPGQGIHRKQLTLPKNSTCIL